MNWPGALAVVVFESSSVSSLLIKGKNIKAKKKKNAISKVYFFMVCHASVLVNAGRYCILTPITLYPNRINIKRSS